MDQGAKAITQAGSGLILDGGVSIIGLLDLQCVLRHTTTTWVSLGISSYSSVKICSCRWALKGIAQADGPWEARISARV